MRKILQKYFNAEFTEFFAESRRVKKNIIHTLRTSVYSWRSLRFFFFLFLLFSILTETTQAQISQWRFFIGFTDKNNNPFSLSTPSAFLSAKAIQRRTNQNIIYKMDDLPVNPQYIDSVIAKGATVWNRTKWLNGVTISVPDTATYNKVIALPFVNTIKRVERPGGAGGRNKFEEVNSVIGLRVAGNDHVQSFYGYGQSYNQIHLMNGDYLHDLGYHGEGMVIAIIDVGFNNVNAIKPFDSLFANNQVLGTWDFVDNQSSVYEDPSHGCSVLSCIAGNVPDTLVGTAPKASFWLLRSEDGNAENIIEEYNWASAAEYADSAGADIITSSLGYTTFDSLKMNDSTLIVNPENHTYADMNGNTCPASIAADVAASKGLLVLCSAGNSGGGGWHYIVAPSDADSVLSVAAVDSAGYHAGFSSYGPSSDGDAKPNVAAKGVSTIVSYSNGAIGGGSGTSFACPVLAGSAACLWQAHPSLTNMDIFNAIEQSANYAANPNDSLGYGIPDFKLASSILTIPTGVKDVIVYPNPFHNEIRFLTSSMQGKITIELLDELGRSVIEDEKISDGIHAVVLPETANLSKGIYFLRLTKGEKVFVKSVVKM